MLLIVFLIGQVIKEYACLLAPSEDVSSDYTMLQHMQQPSIKGIVELQPHLHCIIIHMSTLYIHVYKTHH